MMRMTFCLLIALASGCASENQPGLERPFVPMGVRDGYRYYHVIINAGRADYPELGERAEQARAEQIKTLLGENGCPAQDFEIVDCRSVAVDGSLIHLSKWNIYYTIRVPIRQSESDKPR
jgi:hypothetical protein